MKDLIERQEVIDRLKGLFEEHVDGISKIYDAGVIFGIAMSLWEVENIASAPKCEGYTE